MRVLREATRLREQRNIREVVREYIGRGYAVVPIPARAKAPQRRDWTRLNITLDSVDDEFRPDMNVGIVLGEGSNGLIDLDIDSLDALAIADEFLPLTGAIFGRASKPASHRLYYAKTPTTQFKTKADGMIVELRSTGAQTVFPGSVHPSGEVIEWTSDHTPETVEALELVRATALLAAATLFIIHWPAEGSRHNAALALSGALLQAGVDVQTAEHFMTIVLSDDRCDDVQAELQCLRDTERKMRDGAPAAGFPSLVELLGSEVRPAQRWLQLAAAESRDEVPQGETPPCTDEGNGERFAHLFREAVRWVPGWGWCDWTGTRWRRDVTLEVRRLASRVPAHIRSEAKRAADLPLRSELTKWAKATQSRSKQEAMLWAAQARLIATVDQFDQQQMRLNVANGTIDLATSELVPHRREDYITKISPVPYDSTISCPTWHTFLRRTLKSDELIAYMQRVFGYALTGATREQCFFVLYGKGANGKSTLLDVLLSLLGDYAGPTDAKTLLSRSSDNIPNDIAALAGLRTVTASEVPQGARLNEVMIKQLTGQDRISARFLYQEFFQFTPQFKVFLAVNHKPEIRGTDEGIWRRVRAIPFTEVIPLEERDKTLPDKLRTELPGILAWAVAGARCWLEGGLAEPQEVLDAGRQYRYENDTFGAFLHMCCERSPTGQGYVTAADLYQVYARWAADNGVDPMNRDAFGKTMSDRDMAAVAKRVGKTTRRVHRGLQLKDEWRALLRDNDSF